MIWFDWALIAVLALSVVVGLWRGFIREVFSIAVWVLALWVAFRYSDIAAGWFEGWVDLPSARAVIGFAGLLIVTLMIGGLAGWLLGKLIDSTGLGGTDRMIGMVFGLVRGLAIIVVILLLARFTPFPEDPWWQESRLRPHFDRLADYSTRWLPENLQEMLAQAEDGDDDVRASAEQSILQRVLDTAVQSDQQPGQADNQMDDQGGTDDSDNESADTLLPQPGAL